MPYRRRSRARTTSRGNSKRFRKQVYRKRGSRAQAYQIARLSKAISRNTRKIAANRTYFQLYDKGAYDVPQYVNPSTRRGYSVIKMLDFERAEPVFALDTLQDEVIKVKHHKTVMKMRITPPSTDYASPVRFTVLHVRLRANVRDQAILNWGNGLAQIYNPADPTSSTPGSTFPNPWVETSTGGSPGTVFVNNKVFNVLSRRTFTLTAEATFGYDPSTGDPIPMAQFSPTVKYLTFSDNKNYSLTAMQYGWFEAMTSTPDANKQIPRTAQSYVIIIPDCENTPSFEAEVQFERIHYMSYA